MISSLPLCITDDQRSLFIPLSPSTGIVDSATWRHENFSLSPFCMINSEVAVAETATATYLCTPECITQKNDRSEITLVARGTLAINGKRPDTLRVPWELQLTTTYHPPSGCFALWIRPEVHWHKAHRLLLPKVLAFGWRLQWSKAWLSQGERWAMSPQGALVSIPAQDGVSTVATATAVTLLADHTAPAALLLIELPLDNEPGFRAEPQASLLASTRTALSVHYPGLCNSMSVGNGLPVATTWDQARSLIQVNAPDGGVLRQSFLYAPSVATVTTGYQDPGRYYCQWEWAPAKCTINASLQLAFPFRFWPKALQHQAQAEFAQLLLTSDVGTDFVVAYNFVNPTDVYLADDRDDILAEQAALAHALGEHLADPDLYALAVQMVERLLMHQQPDGGFTFGVSVNGFRGDYSDTNADVIQCLLRVARCKHASEEQRRRWVTAAWRSAGFMLTFQDPTGFFWGRTDRPTTFRYGMQPWFTSYASVACLELIADNQAYAETIDKWNKSIPPPAQLLQAAEKGLRWLCQSQASGGWFRFDTEGYYADYDDLSNTAVSVWALCRACQLMPEHPDHRLWWAAACRGMAYLLTLEQPALSGQFAGQSLSGVQKLVYDYKLGAALEAYQQLRCMGLSDSNNLEKSIVVSANKRYLQHIRHIQGAGILTGGWASLYSLTEQAYLADYQWFERGSKWQQYVFLGWQGKLILLDLPS